MSTPIDPRDTAKLKRAFVAGVRANLDDPMAGVVAVARAVLPEGFVAVPVADLRYLIDDYHSEGIGCAEASRLKALLPKEATDES